MSASPAGTTPGSGANGNKPPPPRRLARPKPTNPLVTRATKRPKKPGATRPQPPTSAPKTGSTGQHGSLASRPGDKTKLQNTARFKNILASLPLEDRPFGDTEPSLFEQPPKPGTFTDYGVYTTKKALIEGLRLHVARLTSHKKFDIRDTSQFTPPLYLLRRDLRAPIPGSKEEQEMKDEQDVKPEGAEEEAAAAEREAEKAAAKAEIAPSQGGTKPRQRANIKKTTSQVFMKEQTAEQQYKQQLKYEESLPWHLEDYDHKQSWMGTYEEMSSQIFAQFKFEERNGETVAVLTPVEKWYKFTPKIRVDAELLRQQEEVQQRKGRSASPEFLKAFERQIKKEEAAEEDNKMARGRFFTAKGKSDELGTKADEELDFEEDWADDEAPPEIEGEEEDIKETEKRIKKDQLKSNVFNMVGDEIYDDEDQRERRESEYRKKVGKKTAKALFKREHNAIYESDEENLYGESTDSTDTEEEILREKEKKEAEAKATAASATASVKPGSGASSRNNTPGHRPSKHPLPLSKAAAGLKRPGSPNLSEASGNESSTARKKQKKSKMPGSSLVPSSNPPSRPRSPANGGPNRPGMAAPRGSFAGSGSDTDTPGGNRLLARSRLAAGGRSPSPGNSGTPGGSRMGSRAGSPEAAAAGPRPPAQKFRSVPSNEVLKSLIPPEGMPLSQLGRFFDISQEERKILVSKIKEVSVYDKLTKVLKPL